MDAQELKRIREAIGWTVQHAAAQFHRPVTIWRNYESGRTAIPWAVEEFMDMKATLDLPKIKPEPRATPAHLTAFRQAFKLTQEKASDLLGVSRITWNRWENGQTAIPKHMLHTLRGMVQQLRTEQQESKP